MKPWLRFALPLVFALSLVGVSSRRFGLIPPVSFLLNPFNGAWKRAPSLYETGSLNLAFKGLEKPVRVVVDTDQVKHVFAESDHDLYFAQGFVLASERLWQMEFMVRTAEGRLSEVMSEKTLDFDQYFTRIGLPAAALQSSNAMMADPLTGPAIRAYADGVNAYIATLSEQTMPFEYKMLGFTPRAWDPRTAAYLLKFMSWSLSASASDLPMSRTEHVLGRASFDELFPLDLQVPEPIIPTGIKQVEKSVNPTAPKEIFEPSIESLQPMPTPNPMNGSNNWAVSGKKSETGLPILSNDIHLGLSLPALWYEMQLVSPNQNVYGIALPGAPGIILGFNKSLAWGVTNGGDDAMDWFQLRFRDQRRSEYLFDGSWRPVISREVQIPVRFGKPVSVTLRETHYGPIPYDQGEKPLSTVIPSGLALKWTTLNESNEIKNFMLINRARDLVEFRKALDGYQTPTLNFLAADNKGQVALWHMGRMPLRWKGQGRLIGDGSSSVYDWKTYLAADEEPMMKNPSRGFLSSANQPPFEFSTSPHWYGWPFESSFRPTRINELLRAKKKFSATDFIKMQRDTLAVSMRVLIPVLRMALDGDSLKPEETEALRVLSEWDFRFEEESVGAALAFEWWKEIETGLWGRLLPERRTFSYPPLQKTIDVLNDPKSHWFDNPATEKVETRAEIVHAALDRALAKVNSKCGVVSKCRWATYRPTDLAHLGHVPGLGDDSLSGAGMEHSIFANTGNHGPVWKMVVALGPTPTAYGVYPGGQSGDPFNAHYDDFVDPWRAGQMKKLEFMIDVDGENSRRLGVMKLEVAK